MNLANLLARTARAAPGLPAVFLGTRHVHDYGTLARRAATLGRALGERFEPGARVALFMTNHPAYRVAYLGPWIPFMLAGTLDDGLFAATDPTPTPTSSCATASSTWWASARSSSPRCKRWRSPAWRSSAWTPRRRAPGWPVTRPRR